MVARLCVQRMRKSGARVCAGSTLLPLVGVRRLAGTSREPPSSSTSAVDKVTARHYWGAADQGDVEAGEEEEEADEEGGGCQDGRQPEERRRV